jgi:hypothetical protein
MNSHARETHKMNRKEILEAASQAVTVDRAATHGDAEDNFAIIGEYWSTHLGLEVSAHDVAVMMCLFKLARIKANPTHQDSATDLCGYGAIAGELGSV